MTDVLRLAGSDRDSLPVRAYGDGQIERNFPTSQDKPPGPLIMHKPLFNLVVNMKRMKNDRLSGYLK